MTQQEKAEMTVKLATTVMGWKETPDQPDYWTTSPGTTVSRMSFTPFSDVGAVIGELLPRLSRLGMVVTLTYADRVYTCTVQYWGSAAKQTTGRDFREVVCACALQAVEARNGIERSRTSNKES